MNDEKTNILVAVPTMGAIHPILVSRLLKWAKRPDVSFYFTYRVAPVDRARNQIVEVFLGNSALTHLLMIDSDTIPPEDAIDRLLSHGKEVVTGLTPILTYKENGWESYDNAFISREADETGKVTKTNIAQRNTGLQEVFRCGAACILIARAVFAKLPQPYYAFETNEENTTHKRSEDIRFCDMVRDAGFAIYADTDVVCQHHKDIML